MRMVLTRQNEIINKRKETGINEARRIFLKIKTTSQARPANQMARTSSAALNDSGYSTTTMEEYSPSNTKKEPPSK